MGQIPNPQIKLMRNKYIIYEQYFLIYLIKILFINSFIPESYFSLLDIWAKSTLFLSAYSKTSSLLIFRYVFYELKYDS